MKGIVFTEFLDLVEDKFGLEMVDKIISQSKLESEGIYTSIGTYSFSEMLQLLQNLSSNTGISTDNLLLVYAEHFFSVLKDSYPGLLDSYKDPIEMIASIENHIHVEVRKIYPDAELPTFIVESRTDTSLIFANLGKTSVSKIELSFLISLNIFLFRTKKPPFIQPPSPIGFSTKLST